jgi:formyl-CoA transferase
MNDTSASPPGALADLRVLELGTLIAGPFCGQLLGDMGAEVIKIEAPGQGDPMRHWGPQPRGEPSVWWPVIGRNKKGITLDLRQDEGQSLMLSSRIFGPGPSRNGAAAGRSFPRSIPG